VRRAGARAAVVMANGPAARRILEYVAEKRVERVGTSARHRQKNGVGVASTPQPADVRDVAASQATLSGGAKSIDRHVCDPPERSAPGHSINRVT
jgi:hypothetical protein